MPDGDGYPILSWQLPSGQGLPTFSGGTGEAVDPYLISNVEELTSVGHNPRLMTCDFKLVGDLDLAGLHFYPIGRTNYPYRGIFDGNDHTITNLTIQGEGPLGLFSVLASEAEVRNLGVVDVNVAGSGLNAGALVGDNHGAVIRCHSTGTVHGENTVGGLLGSNRGSVKACYSVTAVRGGYQVGGLIGMNRGLVDQCFGAGPSISGGTRMGGLIGTNWGGVLSRCYSTAAIDGGVLVGGLVGLMHEDSAMIYHCYSAASFSRRQFAGGLVGRNAPDSVAISFWDAETSGLVNMCSSGSDRGCDDSFGLTTAEMQTAGTFLEAGWDFVDETDNGTDDIWWILEGQDYPRLWWELNAED
jgi:hypothetical protein